MKRMNPFESLSFVLTHVPVLFFFSFSIQIKETGKGLQGRVIATPIPNRTKKRRRRRGNAFERIMGSGPFSNIMCTNIGTTRDLQS
jgi:hypothetical protein